jgi:hypothetical protein
LRGFGLARLTAKVNLPTQNQSNRFDFERSGSGMSEPVSFAQR